MVRNALAELDTAGISGGGPYVLAAAWALGSRVQAVIREILGEKIDIVEFDDDVAQYVRHALNPASINRVAIRHYDRPHLLLKGQHHVGGHI